jgi:hypothetical protein
LRRAGQADRGAERHRVELGDRRAGPRHQLTSSPRRFPAWPPAPTATPAGGPHGPPGPASPRPAVTAKVPVMDADSDRDLLPLFPEHSSVSPDGELTCTATPRPRPS